MTDATLVRLAEAWDIQTSYFDLQQREIRANPDAVLAALRAMGAIETATDVPEALARSEARHWRWSIEPVTVAWDGRSDGLSIRVPASARTATGQARVELQDGSAIEQSLVLASTPVLGQGEAGGDEYIELRVTLPQLALGYHRLAVEVAGHRLESLIIAAPRKVYRPGLERQWGVFLPLYALHSRRSWGIGDYTDLRRLIEWAGSKGAALVATLPLLPTFVDRREALPFEPSPYQPVSRLFWNEVFIDPESPFDGGEGPAVDPELAARARGLLASREVDYGGVMALKRQALEAQARALSPESDAGRAMEAYFVSRPDVRDYGAFRAAMETLGPDWRRWPSRQNDGVLDAGDYDGDTARYYAFAQWRAHCQMIAAGEAASARGMRSYLDLPVGVHQQGYDAWRYRAMFGKGMTVGAPPDLLSANGQNWGFQPLLPRAQRASGYDYFVRFLRHYFASAKMLRIDHAIGLHRLYWIPEGATGRDGVFVRQPADELYAVLCLESVRNQAVVVGEDLGLVPPEVSRGLQEHGISSMYVQMFELTGEPEEPQAPPPVNAVASFSTHDLPPFAAYWEDDDLKLREALGLLPATRVAEEREGRKQARSALVTHLRQRGLVEDGADTGDIFRGSSVLLAESNARWVMLNLEDAWGETRSQNLPGTESNQHANWVSRAAVAFDDFESTGELTEALDAMEKHRKGAGYERLLTDRVPAPEAGSQQSMEGV